MQAQDHRGRHDVVLLGELGLLQQVEDLDPDASMGSLARETELLLDPRRASITSQHEHLEVHL
tara:strand:- start:238 stop:426 length:189 start_codon:yes stop_codon:yes gene_type:complete